MSFSVSFHSEHACMGDPPACQEFKEVGEDYESLVVEACEEIAGSGRSTFSISGFGDEDWPLDVKYDLSVFIEQLPGLIVALREGVEFGVDLYSQGIERTLTFSPNGDSVAIDCESRTGWMPSPRVEVVQVDELMAMFGVLAMNFSEELRGIGSNFSQILPFSSWSMGDCF